MKRETITENTVAILAASIRQDVELRRRLARANRAGLRDRMMKGKVIA